MDDNHSLVPLSSNELVKANNSISITDKLLNIKSKCIIQININYEMSIKNCVMLENYEMFIIEIVKNKNNDGETFYSGSDNSDWMHSENYILKHVNYLTGEVIKELNICGAFHEGDDTILKYDSNSKLIYFSYFATDRYFEISDDGFGILSSELYVICSLTFKEKKNITNCGIINRILVNYHENEILIEYNDKIIVYNQKDFTSKSIYNFEKIEKFDSDNNLDNTYYKSLGLFAIDTDLNKIININNNSIEIQHYFKNKISLHTRFEDSKYNLYIDYCIKNKLIAYSFNDSINIYDLRKEEIINSIQNIDAHLLISIKYSNQGRFLSLIYDNELLIYETNSYTLIDKIGVEIVLYSGKLEYSTDDKYLIYLKYNSIDYSPVIFKLLI